MLDPKNISSRWDYLCLWTQEISKISKNVAEHFLME